MTILQEHPLSETDYQQSPLPEYFGFNIRCYTDIIQFDSEEAILHEGGKPGFLYYLREGRAKLFLSHGNGRISLINFLNDPCFIGEMELIGAQDAANGVTAITPCICYAIRINECRDRILNDVVFLRHICLFLSKKAIGNTANYSRNQSWPLKARLADFILLTSYNGIYKERHTEISEYLGVTYRHLLYVLADFVKHGLLLKTTQGYYIQNAAALREIAEGRLS
ncbi:MAG: transcriptional regulator YeiL [Clostridiales bacterium]|nr:transcriptional regulator YeiL [Clostridiales bacterium]